MIGQTRRSIPDPEGTRVTSTSAVANRAVIEVGSIYSDYLRNET